MKSFYKETESSEPKEITWQELVKLCWESCEENVDLDWSYESPNKIIYIKKKKEKKLLTFLKKLL